MSGQRSAIVTGAASGLGQALAVRLGRDGWRIALADRNVDGCRETLRQVEKAGGSGQIESLDVTSPDDWRRFRDRLEADWSDLDLLINNAGVAGSGDVGQYSLADWQWLLSVNLFGVIYGCHTMIDWLKANPRGAHVINTASLAAFAAAPGAAGYNVSKAAVVALSETLYSELQQTKVSVTVLCPGFFRTKLLEGARFASEAHSQAAQSYMQNAEITAEEVAEAAVRAIERKRLYVVMGRRARWVWRVKRWLPMLFMNTAWRGYVPDADRPAPDVPEASDARRAPDASAATDAAAR